MTIVAKLLTAKIIVFKVFKIRDNVSDDYFNVCHFLQIYVTIKTKPAAGEDPSKAETLCTQYSPPTDSYVVVDKDLNVTLVKKAAFPDY